MAASKVYTPTDVTVTVIGESADPAVLAQVEGFLAAPRSATFAVTFCASPAAHDDPLLPAVTRFVAARPFTGPGALRRRFGIGLQRARCLLTVLVEQRLVRGHWCRRAAIAFLNDSEVWAFRMYRVQPWAWASLPVPTVSQRQCWASGLIGELDKFAECGSLEQVRQHVWFIESLLTRVQAMGLNAAEVAPYRRQLIECAGAARRRLLPRWREGVALFGAEFFGVADDVYPVSVTIEVVE
ncbi:hypothetical protein ACIQU2_27420 [Pseudomonas sp. NPDC098740]|uniref:hypothetical protein n=1 Tax=Pseudomonas sp. NPDC098740 TaxID=3364486 RepID=UPI00383B0938